MSLSAAFKRAIGQFTGLIGYNSSNDDAEGIQSTSGALHVTLATKISGEDQTNDVLKVERQMGYERVEASATDQALGATGAAGDLLEAVIVEANTGAITIKDGGTTVLTLAASWALGRLELNLVSSAGAWTITTAAATSCLAVGRFT